MAIQIRRSNISARLGRRARPVETSYSKQATTQGIQEGLGIAKAIYGQFAQAAESDFVAQMETGKERSKLDFEKRLSNAETTEQINDLIKNRKSEWTAERAKLASDARKGLWFGSEPVADAYLKRKEGLDGIEMERHNLQQGHAAMTGKLVESFDGLVATGNYDDAVKLAAKNKEFLGSSFGTMVAKANKAEKETNRQARLAFINDNPEKAIEMLESGKLEKAIGKEMTEGEKIEFRNMALNAVYSRRKMEEIFTKEIQTSREVDVNSYLTAAESDVNKANASILEMSESDDKETQKKAQKYQERMIKRNTTDPVTDPKNQMASQEAIANFLGGKKELEEAVEELQVQRFDKEGVSQKDFMAMQSFLDLNLTVDSKQALSATLKQNMSAFTKTKGTGMAYRSVKDEETISQVNKLMLEWAQETPKDQITPQSIQETNEELVKWVKKGNDPGEIEAAKDLTSFMQKADITLEDSEAVRSLMAAGVSISAILQKMEEAYPDVSID